MNTREREVMDAAAELCRQIVGMLDVPARHRDDANSLRERIDALLAEGSASSEGAEAVEYRLFDSQWVNVVNHDNCYRDWDKSDAINHAVKMTERYMAENIADGFPFAAPHPSPERTRPQPAQGEHEQRSCEGSLPFSAWSGCGGTGEVDSGGQMPWGAPAMIECSGCPDCEGSERRPIADEVVELSSSLEEDAALLRGLIDDGVPPADDLDRIADSMERASAFLKYAHPGGLHTLECDARPGDRLATFAFNPALHVDTADLVARFAAALAAKLYAAQEKYGYSDGWLANDWMDECRTKLVEHVAKGDPRDVAAYCAFLWHHGERTALPRGLPAGSDAKECSR